MWPFKNFRLALNFYFPAVNALKTLVLAEHNTFVAYERHNPKQVFDFDNNLYLAQVSAHGDLGST